ncbi:unnamed protein product [Diplocarpon coronariae]|uniref:Dienelactone hydrolase family protein n=1 Tax=Diplocarpon coronariae TaxID=2795749 RepID=A0A218ZAR4_9HELO|nr:dienelactone hydrolase family protein [Marssonina coronariae]
MARQGTINFYLDTYNMTGADNNKTKTGPSDVKRGVICIYDHHPEIFGLFIQILRGVDILSTGFPQFVLPSNDEISEVILEWVSALMKIFPKSYSDKFTDRVYG